MPPTLTPGNHRTLNAATHAVLARTNVIPGVESEEEWQRFREAIVADLQPIGAAQEEIAGEIARLMWRRRRVSRMELACFDQAITAAGQAGDPYSELAMPTEAELQKVARYEAHLTRDLQRCLRILKDLRNLPAASQPSSTPAPDPRGKLQRSTLNAQPSTLNVPPSAFNLEDWTNTLIRDADAVIARAQAARAFASNPSSSAPSLPSAPSSTPNCETNPASIPAADALYPYPHPHRPQAGPHPDPPQTHDPLRDQVAFYRYVTQHSSRRPAEPAREDDL